MDKTQDKFEKTLQNIRYRFEHLLLPSYCSEGKGGFVSALLEDNGILFSILDDLCKRHEVDNYYPREKFIVNPIKISSDILALQLIFPNPEWVPNCFCAYYFFNMDFSLSRYFTIEYSEGEPAGVAYICEWAGDRHLNYGVHDVTDGKDLDRCVELLEEE